MEPRVRANGDQAQQNFTTVELKHLLFAHGDVRNPLESSIKTLDHITTDYIIQICFGAAQHAALQNNRAKIKVDDILYAIRKNPAALGKYEEMNEKKKTIEQARKAVQNEDDLNAAAKEAEKGRGKRAATTTTDDFPPGFQKNLKKSKKAFA